MYNFVQFYKVYEDREMLNEWSWRHLTMFGLKTFLFFMEEQHSYQKILWNQKMLLAQCTAI